MSALERLQTIVKALPSDASAVTFTRADLRALLQEAGVEEPPGRDLTVDDVAELVGRSVGTVRGWLIAGQLRGYKLPGDPRRAAWRITPEALREFQERAGPEESPPDTSEVDISSWRHVGEGGE